MGGEGQGRGGVDDPPRFSAGYGPDSPAGSAINLYESDP